MTEELYHWTHRKNYRSILEHGLLTRYSIGRVPLVWACREDRLLWAAGHVAERHGWDHGKLIVFRLSPGPLNWRHTSWHGVRTTGSDIPRDMIVGVKLSFLDPFLHLDLSPSND